MGATLRCRVCRFTEVRTDLVADREYLLLATCTRCDHRWTSHAEGSFAERAGPARVRLARAPERGIASA
jgi:hypothetical protein